MLDNDVKKFLEKLAETSDATGASQLKQRVVGTTKRHSAEGTGIGAALGLAAGHLSAPKEKALLAAASRLGGLGFGAYAGHKIGDKGSSQVTTTTEGTVKKQTKEKGESATAKIPSITDESVLKLLKNK